MIATFLRCVAAIGAIQNPTERARVALLTFGRGYADVLGDLIEQANA